MARVHIEIDLELCDGCGVCVPACSQSALRLEGGKARFQDAPGCDHLERCLGACPRGALRLRVGRPAPAPAPGAAGRGLPGRPQTR
ncbi:MAG TPA: 4Fe-4S binding protein [Myxococcales bacterium]|jgi:ferredoxin